MLVPFLLLWWKTLTNRNSGEEGLILASGSGADPVHCGGEGMAAGAWGWPGSQGAEGSYFSPHKGSRERKRSVARLWSLKARLQWCTSPSKALSLKGSKTFPSCATNQGPSVQTLEPTGDISYSNHNKGLHLSQKMLLIVNKLINKK